MNKALIALAAVAVLFGCAKLIAVPATVTVSFDASPDNPANVEHFVERRVGATWVEVAKGPSAPLVFTLDVTPGTQVTARVKSRIPGVAGSESAASNEASAVVPLKAPANVGIILAVQ